MTANSQALPTLSAARLPTLTTFTVGWLVSLFFALLFNQHLFSTLAKAHDGDELRHLLFMASTGLFALVLINLLVALGGFRGLFKGWIILLLLTGSLAAYFTNSYGVIIDHNMIRNIMQTDWQEATELLNGTLLLYFFLLGVLPSLVIARLKIRYASLGREILHKLAVMLASLLVIGMTALAFYQDYASAFRNHRELRSLVVPTGYVYSLYSWVRDQLKAGSAPLKTIGLDAHVGARWATPSPRKAVVILVVGETARAENFSLNGYPRETNPQLERENVINFSDVYACGTSTAVSLPCMFSRQSRSDFDADTSARSENLLDVLHHAGIPVLWRDNNSGCKGLCDRSDHEEFSPASDPRLCNGDECFDMVLMNQLEQKIDGYDQAAVIVLHQKGSHGPAYFLRAPREFQRFSPVCHTNQLQQCSKAEIVNAYDNTILYTDHVLTSLIHMLQQRAEKYDSALLYVSDHGESLSENNLYLHGIPYAFAPDQQTHVPLLMWFSASFAHRFGIDTDCLHSLTRKTFSHDNLFDTLLGMLNIETSLYQRSSDILAGCTTPD